jgi:hypothetical protein
VTGRYMTAPSTPYTITALIAATRDSNNNSGVGIGWYDGTNKIHFLSYVISGGGAPILQVNKYSSPTVAVGADFTSSANAFPAPIWMQIKDDGTNVSFAFSQDGLSFLQVFTVAKASGYLGATGYSKVIFAVNPQGASRTLGTVMSWTQN